MLANRQSGERTHTLEERKGESPGRMGKEKKKLAKSKESQTSERRYRLFLRSECDNGRGGGTGGENQDKTANETSDLQHPAHQ